MFDILAGLAGLIKMYVKSGGVVQLSRNPDVPKVSRDNTNASRLLLVPCRVWRIVNVEQRPYCVSLVDPDRPRYFVRHTNFLLQMDFEYAPFNAVVFDLDASFLVERDTFYSGYYSLRSVNYPLYYVQARNNGRMGIGRYQNTAVYHDTASFAITFHN